MSSFSSHHVQSLLAAAQSAPSTPDNETSLTLQEKTTQTPREEKLYSLLLQLKSPLDRNAVRSTLLALHEQQSEFISGEGSVIKLAIERRIIVGLYAEALDEWLKEARDADTEAEWWDDVARSSKSVAWYLLATVPQRVVRSVKTVLHALRARNIPIRPSSFSPRIIHELFPTVSLRRPSALGTAFFPHLAQQRHLSLASPLELTRQECENRRRKLLQLRDERALQLGELLSLKDELEDAIRQEDTRTAAAKVRHVIIARSPYSSPPTEVKDPIGILYDTAFAQLNSHATSHSMVLTSLRRPSRLTLLWPRLALVPPAALLLFRMMYNSRESIMDSALRAHDTIKGFWFGYIVEPVRDILDTVRSGGEDGARIINQEAVRADMESLERMAVDLSRDRLSLNESQMRQVSEQIRQGNLTPVLRIYEEDIKAPVRTALTGRLVRSLLIQIQKAKVDLDQALAGIDKLLKSQELTFAFVGVAPAFALVYLTYNGVRTVWAGGRGDKKYGGRREREGAWLAIRRVERLLITSSDDARSSSSPSKSGNAASDSTLPPLTSGLLLIAVARLREFAEARLPEHSLVRSGMLADIVDLESPTMGRGEKLRIVERMWRSWGRSLGWDQAGRLQS